MKLFLGEYDHALDERGRVTLPKKIRNELETNTVILAQGFDTCVFGYDKTEWEHEAEKQMTASVTDKTGRMMRRYLFGSAEKAEIDKLGRVVLPAHLKEYAGIHGEVKVIGAGDHFELWDRKAWETYSIEMKKEAV